MTLNNLESTIFNGAKNIVGSLELDGFLNIDANPGSEKVTNGSFTGNATGWTLGAEWAYGSNAVAKSGAGTSTLSQDVSAIANETYKVVYTTSGISGGAITVSIGGVSGTARTTNATFTEYITATGTGNLTFTPASATAVTIDDVSVKRVGVAAADRVTAWVGDRIASGVEAAGDAGLFLRSEDGTQHFLGDTSQIGGALLVNASAAYGNAGQLLEINKSAGYGGWVTNTWSAVSAGHATWCQMQRSRSSTIGTHTIVQNSDELGRIRWMGSDGSQFQPAADIIVEVDGTPGGADMPGRILFLTTADGAASVTEAMRINKSQFVSVGGIDGLAPLHVSGAVATNRGQLSIQASTTNCIISMYESTNYQAYLQYISDVLNIQNYNDGVYGGLALNPSGGNVGIGMTVPAIKLQVDDVIGVSNDAEGSTAHLNIRSTRVLTAALSGATVNMAFQIPSGAMILGAQFNVNTLIEGATSWSAAFNTGSTTSLGSGYALTLDTKVNKLIVPEITTGLTDITLTAAGSNFTAGVIECVVYYCDVTSMANA